MKLPQTPEEAKQTRYNSWAGNPKGNPYDPSRCAAGVWSGGRGSMEYQCSKKPGKGPHGLFCAIHAPLCEGQPTQIWYRDHGSKIEEVHVSQESDKFIWVDGRKREKHGPWGPSLQIKAGVQGFHAGARRESSGSGPEFIGVSQNSSGKGQIPLNVTHPKVTN